MGLGDRMGRRVAAAVSVLRSGGRAGRFRLPAVVLLGVLLAPLVAGCSAPDFGDFSNELKFGDETVSDTQVTDTMRIPSRGLGSLIREDQVKWMMNEGKLIPNPASPTAPPQKIPLDRKGAIEELKNNPVMQCQALSHTSQSASPSEGAWKLQDNSCVKQRELSWLEKTLWSEYEKQSKENFAWLTTSRNTLKANPDSVETLKRNTHVDYNNWGSAARPYLNILLGFCTIVAVISLMCVGVRLAQQANRADQDSRIMDKLTWIFLGAFAASSAGAIAAVFFMPNGSDGSLHEPSWTPGRGATYYLSDWIRAQLDPIIIIAAVVGVMASGITAAVTGSGKGYIRIGKAFMQGLACNILLAGGITVFQDTIDSWTASLMKASSSMMNDAWNHNALNASQFFGLDGFLAVALVLLIWIMGMVMKVFTYLRAGMLPVLVALAGVFSVMSFVQAGDSSFKKVLGWLATFLAYKPAAALFMATGSAIMVTAGLGDDSATITVFLQIGVIAMLPLLVRWIVPAAQGMSMGGGGGLFAGMASWAAGGAVSMGGGAFRGLGGLLDRRGGGRGRSGGGKPPAHGSSQGKKENSGGKGPGGTRGGGKGPDGTRGGGAGQHQDGSGQGGSYYKGPDGSGHGSGQDGSFDQGPDGSGHQGGVDPGPGPVAGGGRRGPDGTRGQAGGDTGGPSSPGGPGSAGPDGVRRSSARRNRKEF